MDRIIFMKILMSVILGGAIGLERELKRKPAGLITLTLVCLGATMIAILQLELGTPDQTRLAAQVISGVGFIGAGSIIQSKGNIQGVTTAAILWVTACLGLIIGYGLLKLAVLCTGLILVILVLVKNFEEQYVHSRRKVKVLIKVENKGDMTYLKEKFESINLPIKLTKINWQNFEENLIVCIFILESGITINTLETELLNDERIKVITTI